MSTADFKKRKPQAEPAAIKSLIVYIRKESYLAGTFYSGSECTLVLGASACSPARQNFCALGNKLAKLCYILIIDLFNTVNAEMANLFSCLSVKRSIGLLHFRKLLSLKSERTALRPP